MPRPHLSELTIRIIVSLLGTIAGILIFQLFHYDVFAIWTHFSLQTKAFSNSTEWIVLAKPFLLFGLGSYCVAALYWVRQKGVSDFHPLVVSMGAVLGVIFIAASSKFMMVPAYFVLMLLTGPFITIFPEAYQSYVLRFGLFVTGWLFAGTVAFLGSLLAMRFIFKKPKGIYYRVLTVVLGTMVFIVPLVFTINREDHLLEASKSIRHDLSLDRQMHTKLRGEPRLVHTVKNKHESDTIQAKLESQGIKFYVEEKYNSYWIYVNKKYLYRAKYITHPHFLKEASAKYKKYVANDEDKHSALIIGWDLVDAYGELGRHEDAIELLNDMKNKGLIDKGQKARFNQTYRRIHVKREQ